MAIVYEIRPTTASPGALTGVPQTMLWTLHHRACEALRADAFLRDPEAVRVYRSIRYDYAKHFGKPDESHPMRSRLFDRALRPWILANPGATVVELACGLETQFFRCDDGDVRWVCVDLPEALEVRRRFLPEAPRCRFVAKSALDPSWMDGVDASRGLFVTAQGLFMYFEEREVRALVRALFERFARVELLFDTTPRRLSRKTLSGLPKTERYRAPPMPWGIDRDQIEPALRSWSDRVGAVSVVPYGAARGLLGASLPWLSKLPWLRNLPPLVVHVTGGTDHRST